MKTGTYSQLALACALGSLFVGCAFDVVSLKQTPASFPTCSKTTE
jgi:hypothetical protein